MANTILDAVVLNESPKVTKPAPSIVFRDVINFDDGSRYVVIYVGDNSISLCRLDTTKIEIRSISAEYISELFRTKRISIEALKNTYIDVTKLNDKVVNKHNLYKTIIKKVEMQFGPDYLTLKSKEGTEFLHQLSIDYSMTTKCLWKIIRSFLQGGLDYNLLYDKRALRFVRGQYAYNSKPGRKNINTSCGKLLTDNDLINMKEFIDSYLHSNIKSLMQAYKDMRSKYYTIRLRNEDGTVLIDNLDDSLVPSYRQFSSLYYKVTSAEERELMKARRKDVRPGNRRLLDSDFLFGVRGPTSVVEMDEQEMDFSTVATFDPTLCIGRCIIHLIIDVQTRLILAISVSLDNNSVIGATHCLMNLYDDKKEFCKRYGIDIPENVWPGRVQIGELRTDRGSEYESHDFERICNELGITYDPTPAGTGSEKGTVESQFHIFNSMWNDIMENYGLILKRHDSNHHEEATLTYEKIYQICINNVLRHNMTEIDKFYGSKEFLETGMTATPINLWKFYDAKYHSVYPIANPLSFLYALMTPKVAYISKKGVRWEGLWYQNDDIWIEDIRWSLGNKTQRLEVRMDERDVSKLYYIRDNRMFILRLNPDKTFNMDFDEMPLSIYKEFRALQKHHEGVARERKIALDVINRELTREILAGSKTDTYAKIKEMNAARSVQKALIQSENNIYDRISKLAEGKTVEDSPKKIDTSATAESASKNNAIELKTTDDWSQWSNINDTIDISEMGYIDE